MAPATLPFFAVPGGYPLFRQRSLAYPPRPASPLPRSSSVPGSGTARDSAITAGIDEIDAEAIGTGPNVAWLRDSIVYPQPGHEVSVDGYIPGWVQAPADYQEFAEGLCTKFQMIVETEDLADLAVIKMSKPDDQVHAGEPFVYTIFVENLGPTTAYDVGLRDEIVLELGSTLQVLSAEPEDPVLDTCEVVEADWGYTIECLKGSPLFVQGVELEGRWTVQVTLVADETQDVNNLVTVFSSVPDPDLSNNMAEDFIYVTDVADLSIEKSLTLCPGHEGYCDAGGWATFAVTVTNIGPSTAENVVVEDLLPAGVTVDDVSGAGACTTGIPGDPFAPLTCNLGNILPLDSRSIYVTVQIDPDYPLSYDDLSGWVGSLENDGWVYSDIFDPNNGDNRDHVIVGVSAYSELYGRKGCPLSVRAGEELDYWISVSNDGPSTVRELTFADNLTDVVTYLGHEIVVGDGTCWYIGTDHTLFCSLGDVDPDETHAINLTVRVNPDYEGLLVSNDIDETYDWWADTTFGFAEGNSEYYCETAIESLADLSIQKTSEPPKIFPGEQKVYHIEVTNNGPADAPGVVVTDTLPISLTYEIDNSNNDSCVRMIQHPDVLRCELGTIAAGQTVGFDVWALVSPDAPPGEITNEAHVFMEAEVVPIDPDENNWAWATNVVLDANAADLSVVKTATGEEQQVNQSGLMFNNAIPGQVFPTAPNYFVSTRVTAGRRILYTLTVRNDGPAAAENVVLTDRLPAGVQIYQGSLTAPAGVNCATGTPGEAQDKLTCGLGTIASGAPKTVSFQVVTDSSLSPGRVLENDAYVMSDMFDADNGDNYANTQNTVLAAADMTVAKTADGTVTAGEVLHYAVTVQNNGPSDAPAVVVSDVLTDVVTFLQAEGASCRPSTTDENKLFCSLGAMEAGARQTFDLYVRVDPALADGTTLQNCAEVLYSPSNTSPPGPPQPVSGLSPELVLIWDPMSSNNSACADTTASAVADLAITKTADPYKVFAGEQVRYDITVANNGPANAYQVLVTDTLPSEVGFELSTDPDCVPADGDVICNWDVLAPGQTRSFQIFGRVDPAAEPGTVSNRVWVDSLTASDPCEYNDYASSPNLIQGRADLKIRNFGKPDGLVRAGDKLTYTVIVDNLGTGYAHDVHVLDQMNSSGVFELLSIGSNMLPGHWACTESSGTFTETLALQCSLTDTLPVLSPSGGRWILTVVVQANEPQDINNVAYVDASDYDPDLSNNEAIAEHEITAVADLELTKEALGEMLVGCEGETELWLDEVAAGGTVTYTLTISNTGSSTAENVVVLDEPLPSPDLVEIDVGSIEPSQGNCQTAHVVDQQRLSCNLGTIEPDGAATVTFVAHVPSWVPDGTVLVNDAQVYSDMFDDNNANDIVSNQTLVSRVADLEVGKTQDPKIALPGQDITYTIVVTNTGPSDALGAIISDTIPPEVLNATWTCCCSSDDSQCDVPCETPTCPAGECPWPDIGLYAQADIPAGGYAIYTVQGVLDVWPCLLPITNTVEVIAPESLLYEGEDIDPCDECNFEGVCNADEVYNIVPVCNFDPLILKQYPGPDSPP